MRNLKTPIFSVLIASLLISACSTSKNPGVSQLKQYSPVSKELYDTIAHMDDLLFTAFNTRNLDELKKFFSDDLEFYHDLGGVTNYSQNMEAFRKSFEKERTVRRELVSNTLEVYPIKDFGAVQTGIHRFYGTEKGQPEKLGSEAKFLHVWRRKDGIWKIHRVVSYGHQEY